MAQLIKKASKGASIYVNGTKKDLTPEQWDAFKAEFGNSPEMISYFTDENNTSSFRMNDNGTITVNGMPLSTDSRKRRAKRTDDANTEKLYNFFNGLNTVVKGKNIAKYSGDYNLGYDSSEDGKVHTLNRSAVNANAMKRLDALMNFDPNNLDDIEGFENFSDKESLRNYIDQHIRPNYEYLKAALTNGATKEDFNRYKDIFNSIGIYADKKSSGNEGDGTNPTAGTTAEIMGDHIVHDGNGGFRFKDDTINAFMNSDAMKEYVGKNLWLNNEFVDWASKNHGIDFSWITPGTGLFRINGKWVDGSKVNGLTGHDKLAFDNWVKHNIDNPGGDNSKIVQYWGTENPYKYIGGDNYINGLADGSYYIDDSWRYERGNNAPHVYRTWDDEIANQEGFRDVFGHINRNMLKTVYVDSDGNVIQDFDPNTLNLLGENEAIDQLQGEYKTPENPYLIDTEKRKYKSIFQNASKESNEKWGLITDGNGRYYWRHNGMKGYTNDMGIHGDPNGLSFEIDPRVAQWLIKQQKSGKLDQKMAVNIDRLIKSLYHRNKIFDRSGLFDLYKSLGISPSDVFNYTLGEHEYQSGLYDILNSAEAVKRGHIISGIPYSEVEYKQHGGIVAKVKSETKKHTSTDNNISRNVGESKGIGDNTALTGADKAELAALAADLGSAITAFVPGANIASAGIGAAGSVADFAANISRDGLDWGDVGRFALNLGLDAATLIPFAGGAAKATKIAKLITESKAIGKAVNIIGGLSSGAGAGMGIVAAYNNIVNGDDWTIEDIRTVINGIRGITNLSRLKGSATKNGEVTDNSTHTFKDTDITISKKEYDEIMELPKDQQSKKMAELIRSKTTDEKILKRLKTKEEAEKVVKEILGDRPNSVKDQEAWDKLVVEKQGEKVDKGIEELLKDLGIKLNKQKTETTWNPKTWDFWHRGGIKGEIEFKPSADTYRNPNEMSWWNWNRRAAIRDAKTNRNNPYFKTMANSESRYKQGEWYRNDQDVSGYIVGPRHYYRAPIALNTYHNLYPQIFREEVNAENAFDTYYEPIVYKKGGKVLKGKNGISDILNAGNNSILEAQRKAAEEAQRRHDIQVESEVSSGIRHANDYLSRLSSDLEDGELSSPGSVITDSIREKAEAGLPSMQARATATTMSNSNDAFRSTFGNSRLQNGTKNTASTPGGSNTTRSKLELPNLGKTLVDAARFAIGAIGINATAKAKANAIKKSKVEYETPMLSGPRFDNSSIDHMSAANRNRIAMQRMLIPQTSDSTKKFAMQQAISSAENDLKAQENMAYSQNISQFNRLNNEFQNNYAKLRTEIANKNRQEAARVNSALEMNEASRREQMYTHLVQPLVQMSGNYAQYNKTKADAENMMNQLEAKNSYDIETRSAYDEAKARLKTANQDLSGDALNEAIYNDLTYKDAMDKAKRKYLQYSSRISYLNPITNAIEYSSPTLSNPSGSTIIGEHTYIGYKKGGKMSASEKRDLENMKHSHKVHLETIKALIKDIQKNDEYLYKTLLKIVK